MTPADFHAFAANVAARQSGPAGFRSAVSRAYYGAYHSARELVEVAMQISCRFGGNEHKGLQRYFLNCQVAEGIQLGQLLENLHQSRREADYELTNLRYETQVQARLCVERASNIMSRVAQCRDPALSARIKAGIENYKSLTNG